MTEQLDFLEENKEITSTCLADYKHKLSRGYNRNVRLREFAAGELILQRVQGV